MAQLTSSSFDRLSQSLRGQLLTREDPSFESARQIWNAMTDRRPAFIARCAGVADVVHALRAAREDGLPLSVRGGGHNIAGNALCDDGLVIDLSPMRWVRIDPASRRAHVAPGATLRDFDHEAQAFGLGVPLGINSTTGVAGLTLGGGFGWLTRKYGLTIDSLVAADVVTADGTLVRASEDDHPDLFWGLRGGGGNFGIVTRFEFSLRPVGPTVYAGLFVFDSADADRVLSRYLEFVDRAPDDLALWTVLRHAPPLPFLASEVHGRPVVIMALCDSGRPDEGPTRAVPIRTFGRLLGEHVGPMPYEAWQQAFDPLLTPGARNYWKSHNFATLAPAAIDTIVDYASRLPSPHSEVFIGLLGGEASRIPVERTAYPHRDATFVMNVHGRWERPEEDAGGMAWARSLFAAARPYATGGVYVNFMTEDEQERVGAAYGPHHERLVQVKDRYDPHNVFCVNQNIRPSIRA